MWKTECLTAQSAFSPEGWKLNAGFDKAFQFRFLKN